MIGQDLVLKIGGTALLVGALWAGIAWWEHRAEQRGYDKATAEWVEKEREIKDQVEARYAHDLEAARDLSAVLQVDIQKREISRIEKEKEHAKNVDAAVARALAGAERLSVRTVPRACPVPGEAGGNVPQTASAAGAEERSDLVPAAAAEFIRIGAAAARDVSDYNALLDEYEKLEQFARTQCGAQ